MEEEDEEKRSDTPERKDKDDLEKDSKTSFDTKQKEELVPEEKEKDTSEVKGAHASETSSKSKDGEIPKVDGDLVEAASDVSLLSPRRHLERQVSSNLPLSIQFVSSFFCLLWGGFF